MVDNRVCLVEAIDTAGVGKQLFLLLHPLAYPFIEEYATLREQWIRSVLFFIFPFIFLFLNWIFSESQGFILVYSVTSRSSFEDLEDFHRSIRRVKQDNPILVLVGNKCDGTQDREVSKADGAALARQYGCEFIETSAKTTQNVERLFINLVRSLRETKDTKQEPPQSVKKAKKSCNCVIM